MKKLITMLVGILAACQFSYAQSTPAIGSSYTTNVVTDVYPYQVGRKPNPDTTIHFKLNVNTKFQIVDIVTISGGAIKGYVITPWRFSEMDRDKTKKLVFYQKNYANTDGQITLKKTQDSIKKLTDSLKILATQRKADSINVVQSKKAVTDTTNIVNVKSQMVIPLLNSIDPKTEIIIEKSNVNTNAFSNKQLMLKQQYGNVEHASAAEKKQLINAAALLRFKNTALDKIITDYKATEANLDAANRKADTAFSKFARDSVQVPKLKTIIKSLSNSYSEQESPGPGVDKDDYKITKNQINDKIDTPANPNTAAAKLDNLAFLNSWANKWTFYIPATSFSQNKVVPIYTRSDTFTWGFLSLPVKMRFDNSKGRFDFEQNLQFGLTAGDKHQFAKTADVSINYLGGVSVVSVPLKDSTSTTAVSFSIGSMFQYGKFQIGLFGGIDLAGSKAAQFDYQGKPWIGIAIGVSLFGEGQTTATVPNQD